ncbi:MAG: DUF2922 domain-containing protein [Bacillota bacterium]
MAEKRLEMIFKTQMGRTAKVTVDNPRDDLLETDVQAAMQTIITKNIFDTNSGNLVEIDSAQVVTTDVAEVIA